MEQILKIGFQATYENAKLFFTDILSRRYQVVRDDINPDYLIFGDSNFGKVPGNITAKKRVFFTGENVRPNWNECDHAVTFDHINSPKHYRLPLYVMEMWAINKDNNPLNVYDLDYLIKKKIDVEKEWDRKIRFCSYIQSNPWQAWRTQFATQLIKDGRCESAGPHLNTTGFIIPRDRALKMQFFSEGKFGIAMENGSYPGYVTEKLIDCYYANTIPIYWGDRSVKRDFNSKSMIYVDSISDIDGMIDIAMNKNRYMDMLGQPAFNDNRLPDVANIDNFLDWWETFVL